MSHWNYRVLRHPDGVHMVHEVYYDDEGRVCGWAEKPEIFEASAESADPVGDIEKWLRLALKDVRERPVLVVGESEDGV